MMLQRTTAGKLRLIHDIRSPDVEYGKWCDQGKRRLKFEGFVDGHDLVSPCGWCLSSTLGIRTLMMGGLTTGCCVGSTARDAYQVDSQVVTLVDGTEELTGAQREAALATNLGLICSGADVIVTLQSHTGTPVGGAARVPSMSRGAFPSWGMCHLAYESAMTNSSMQRARIARRSCPAVAAQEDV